MFFSPAINQAVTITASRPAHGGLRGLKPDCRRRMIRRTARTIVCNLSEPKRIVWAIPHTLVWLFPHSGKGISLNVASLPDLNL